MNVNMEVAGHRILTGVVWRGPFNGICYSIVVLDLRHSKDAFFQSFSTWPGKDF